MQKKWFLECCLFESKYAPEDGTECFVFGIKGCIYHIPLPVEHEHSGSRNRDSSQRPPKHEAIFFSRMAAMID
jgi:hypothetical protein